MNFSKKYFYLLIAILIIAIVGGAIYYLFNARIFAIVKTTTQKYETIKNFI